jgi:hypothetical protein
LWRAFFQRYTLQIADPEGKISGSIFSDCRRSSIIFFWQLETPNW